MQYLQEENGSVWAIQHKDVICQQGNVTIRTRYHPGTSSVILLFVVDMWEWMTPPCRLGFRFLWQVDAAKWLFLELDNFSGLLARHCKLHSFFQHDSFHVCQCFVLTRCSGMIHWRHYDQSDGHAMCLCMACLWLPLLLYGYSQVFVQSISKWQSPEILFCTNCDLCKGCLHLNATLFSNKRMCRSKLISRVLLWPFPLWNAVVQRKMRMKRTKMRPVKNESCETKNANHLACDSN